MKWVVRDGVFWGGSMVFLLTATTLCFFVFFSRCVKARQRKSWKTFYQYLVALPQCHTHGTVLRSFWRNIEVQYHEFQDKQS